MPTLKRTIPPDVRRQVLERDNNACRECGATRASGAVLHLHHVIPEKVGGREEPSNLITLCDIHHNVRHIEFQAYYPSSETVIARMVSFTKNLLRKIRLASDGTLDRQLKALLMLLTGHGSFRPGQETVVRSLIEGEDVLFVTPTGSGKSLCYQLPGLLDDKPTLVISPQKALIRDQVTFLGNKKVPTTYIDSDVGSKDKANRIRMIRDGLFRFVFVTPERFFWSTFKADNPLLIDYGLLVVDEAHCIDKWGRSFRPAYSQLGVLRKHLKHPRTLALTASASPAVQDRIIDSLGIPEARKVVTGFYRPEISLEVRFFDEAPYGSLPHGEEPIYRQKLEWLKAGLSGNNNPPTTDLEHRLRAFKQRQGKVRTSGKTLVFVPTIATGEKVLKDLSKAGFEVELFHSRLEGDVKNQIQNQFTGHTDTPLDILIATSAFGMGMNIPNIRKVYHWSLPANLEDYYQQVGRAGRDGKDSEAVLFYADGDERLVRYMNEKSRESGKNLMLADRIGLAALEEQELQVMLNYIHTNKKWEHILKYFGEQPEEDPEEELGKWGPKLPPYQQHSKESLPVGRPLRSTALFVLILGTLTLAWYLAR